MSTTRLWISHMRKWINQEVHVVEPDETPYMLSQALESRFVNFTTIRY